MKATVTAEVVVKAWASPNSSDQPWEEFLARVQDSGNTILDVDEPNRRVLIGIFQ